MHLVMVIILVLACSLLLLLFSYVHRLYSEKGRLLLGSKDNVDFFENQIEPRLGVKTERAELTFSLLTQVDLVVLALLVAFWNLGEPVHWQTLIEGGVFLVLEVLLFAQLIPQLLLTRTSGKWLSPFTGLLRSSILAISPLVTVSQFLHHLSALGGEEEGEGEEASASQNIEALIEAGEEEGLIEKEDQRLIRSVIEFGDKTVREVMTPRPEIFAVSTETTIGELKQLLATRQYSRIPVYEQDLDHLIGFLRVLDLFLRSEEQSSDQSVKALVRPLTFVPETKRISELLKEIQQKAPIAIVVDEYGSVAGLVTVEDMVEEIVGEIRDEHEAVDVIPQGEGIYSVPGSMDLDRLQELFSIRIEETGGATTVSGLITGALGRVPHVGEVLETDGLVFEVTESNGRKILRSTIRRPAEKGAGPQSPQKSPVEETNVRPG